MLVDFRASDLIDRVDWDDPDFPAFLRILDRLSIPVTMKCGQRTANTHIIAVEAIPAIIPEDLSS